jgi:hypothetical protein
MAMPPFLNGNRPNQTSVASRKRVVGPRHIASILEEMAAEYPAKSGRRLVLRDAAKLISRYSGSG